MAAPYAPTQFTPIQNIALRLPINQPPTETVPYDLQRYYNRDVWVARQRAVLTKGARFLKPRFEIIFAVFMLLASFAVPIVVYYVVLNALPRTQFTFTDFDGDRITVREKQFWAARAASMGALVGLILLGWLPFLLWKYHGKRQVNTMLSKFSAEDAAVAGNGAQTPQWAMKMPGIGSKAIHLIISYPRPIMGTPYAPGAQPPVYLNPFLDPVGGGNYAPYMAPGHAQGLPHHAPADNMQGVPLYNNSDEKIPDYSGPTSDTYLPHEKERFEDVKV
ncbi:hypothetical protein C8Q77DRAFT_250843 [Trametes polyzona]|nr:hypothetical protein C8Q77DRAFT_250843 [Trametes polyzona]